MAKTIQDHIDFQQDLDKLTKWADIWIYGKRNSTPQNVVMRLEIFYILCDLVHLEVDKTKYLDIMISGHLNSSLHLEYVRGKAEYMTY